MILRQSDLKRWQQCPLKFRFANVLNLPREQSCALTFGTIIHDCVLYMEQNRDLEGALKRFSQYWRDPESLDPALEITYYLKGRTWTKYRNEGREILRKWWQIAEWESDVILGREYGFQVPIGDHHLQGTVDVLALRTMHKTGKQVVLIRDYKTNAKAPTYNYLRHDLQFTAYCYATLQPEFWVDLGEGMFERFKNLERRGEWVALAGPKRMDAGERTEMHYNRLRYAVNNIADSVGLGIFPPNISGESCAYCEYRVPCGIPANMELEDETDQAAPEGSRLIELLEA